ncbi:hypothetical protein EEI76_21810 (plasmid) [Enterobacter cloacae]|nr:hypothetical protein EEI76_21810 [Enterobacter cloacae]
MKGVLAYIILFIYSSLFVFFLLIAVGGVISIMHYLSNGVFYYPVNQVWRAIVFGGICGGAITLVTLLYKIIDKVNTSKRPPSNPKL